MTFTFQSRLGDRPFIGFPPKQTDANAPVTMPTIGDRQFIGAPPTNPVATAPFTLPPVRVDDAQPRFSIEGSGPISGRTIAPATKAAVELMVTAPGVTDAVRGVLRLVEQVAGGPTASSSVNMNGVSFATTASGLTANTVQSHIDDDGKFRATFAKLKPDVQRETIAILEQRKRTETAGMLANVTSGWMNLGPAPSAVLLARAGVPTATRPSPQDVADSVRVLLHETVHVVDDAPANLPKDAMHGMWEALAEARTMSMPQLQAARRTLGLDTVVSDAALASSLTHRPYAAAEELLGRVLRLAQVEAGSELERSIVSGTAHDAVNTLATRIATATGKSEQGAREAMSVAFAEAMRGKR